MGDECVAEFLHGEITAKIIGAAFAVHKALGPGFLESVYEHALVVELGHCGLPIKHQKLIPIFYREVRVGAHRLDLLVADRVVVELKVAKELTDVHSAIALSYLKSTKLSVALLLNFAKPSLEYRRVARTRHSTQI